MESQGFFSKIRYWLVDQPAITQFYWTPGQTPAASLRFLNLAVLGYLSLTLLHRHRLSPLPAALLRPISAAHNLLLLILSAAMALGCSLSALSQMPRPQWLVCFPKPQPPAGPVFFWAYVFYLSKTLEFVDTLLNILGGRRLSFLHVYHHAVVVVMCYVWLSTSQSLLPVALVTNASVHTLMYTYYLLCAVGSRPRWKRVVTDCQIVQFVFSFTVSAAMLYYHFTGSGCSGIWGWCFNAVFNASLLALFIDFHSSNYARKKKKKKVIRDEDKDKRT